jgi:hypothetical protein
VQRRNAIFRAPSAAGWFDFFKTWFGPMITVLNALDEGGRERFRADIITELERVNRATDGTLAAEAEYLEVIAAKA